MLEQSNYLKFQPSVFITVACPQSPDFPSVPLHSLIGTGERGESATIIQTRCSEKNCCLYGYKIGIDMTTGRVASYEEPINDKTV